MNIFINRYNMRVQNYYQFIIPRLNGSEIKDRFAYYRSLVRKGVAGFIVFGGEIEELRGYIRMLQEEAELPLIIASDLEQGLGQQIAGGTMFPPAMAVSSAVKKRKGSAMPDSGLNLLKETFRAMAVEARYAGINTIFAPVLDINTNPRNPIISVRSFGEERKTVSFFGCEMIKTVQRYRVASCGKHFPGHGDTEMDSHIRLPTVKKDIKTLKSCELQPFKKAVEAGVKMMMFAHLNVPALDPSGIPVSLSKKTVRFIREEMKFRGVLMTDALNMGALDSYTEEMASGMALQAGVDVLLHPTDPEKIVVSLRKNKVIARPGRIRRLRKWLVHPVSDLYPDFDRHRRLSSRVTMKSIRSTGNLAVEGDPFLVILNDDIQKKGTVFFHEVRKAFPGLGLLSLTHASKSQKMHLPKKAFVITAVFSETRAWKGGTSTWLKKKIASLRDRASVFISFGSPYVFEPIRGPAKVFVYWDSDTAQRAAAQFILSRQKRTSP